MRKPVEIAVRGDDQYGTPEVMDLLEDRAESTSPDLLATPG